MFEDPLNKAIMSLLSLVLFSILLWIANTFSPSGISLRKQTNQISKMSKKRRGNIPGKDNFGRRKNTPKMPPLESFIESSLEEGEEIILLIDFNNVRGKSDFALTNLDLLFQLEKWKNTSPFTRKIQIVCVIDHGSRSFAYRFYNLGLVTFAGPHRTADDVIAQASHWLIIRNREETTKIDNNEAVTDATNANSNVLVVTSDRELKSRCLRINRLQKYKGKKRNNRDRVKVFESFQLLKCLDKFRRLDGNSIEQSLDGISAGDSRTNDNSGDNNADTDLSMLWQIMKQELSRLEEDIRFYDYKHPPWESGQEKLEAGEAIPYKTTVLSATTTNSSMNLCQQEEILFRSPKKKYNEKTWHRVLIAENMRQMMDRFPVSKKTPNDDILSQYQFRYNQDKNTKEYVPNLFLDHRMRFEPHLQQELLTYFDRALASVEYDDLQATVNETMVNSENLLQISWFHKLKWKRST